MSSVAKAIEEDNPAFSLDCSSGDGVLTTFSIPNISLPSVIGKMGSSFVDVVYGKPVVRNDALFTLNEPIDPTICGHMVTSELVSGRDRYFGVRYPDGTSLPYIPISNVTLSEAKQDECIRMLANERFVTAQVDIRTVQHIAESARKLIFPSKTDNMNYHSYSRTKGFEGMYKCRTPHVNRVWALVGGEYYEQDVFETLQKANSINGVGCFVLKYRKDEFNNFGFLRLEFHSLMVQKDLDMLLGPFKMQEVSI